jgi:hypothetical protein
MQRAIADISKNFLYEMLFTEVSPSKEQISVPKKAINHTAFESGK